MTMPHRSGLSSRFRLLQCAAAAAVVSLLLPAGSVLAQQVVDAPPVTLEILPFERAPTPATRLVSESSAAFDVTDDRTDSVQSALPGVLAAALLPYRHIRVTAGGRMGAPDSNSDRRARSQGGSDNQAEFFVRGTFVVRENEVALDPVLGNRKTGRSRRLKQTVLRVDRLNADALAYAVASEVAQQKQIAFSPRSIALACIRDGAPGKAANVETAIQSSATTILRNLFLNTDSRIVRWSIVATKTCLPPGSLQELAKKEKADALLVLTPSPAPPKSSSGPPTARSALYILALDKHLATPDVPIDPKTGTLNVDKLARQTHTLLGVVMTSTGAWKKPDLPAAGEGAAAYLNSSRQNLAARAKGAAVPIGLLDYLLSMALARVSELSTADAGDARFQLARIRLAQGRVDEAAVLIDEAAAQNQDNFQIRLARAEFDLQRGRSDEAVAQYRELIKAFPTRREAYERLAANLNQRDENQDAAQVYQALVAAVPDAGVAAYRGLAKISLMEGDWHAPEAWDKAASFLQAGLGSLKDGAQRQQLQRELATLYADAGRSYYVKKEYLAALRFFDKSIEVVPSQRTHFYRGNTYYAADDLERALADYLAVISLADAQSPVAITPEYIGSRLSALEILTVQRKYDEAIRRADETLRLFKANIDAANMEPVVLLIRLAAKLAGNDPSYRIDLEELRSVADHLPRRYSFGSFVWLFDTIDEFVASEPSVPAELKCAFKQISLNVQRGEKPACN